MSDDYDLEWDDAFGGDIDFDDDFDMDPYKNKGFFSSLGTGFLSGVTERTFGSTDAVISTARAYLPRSFSNFFDNLSYWNASKDLLVREFEEQNYETVKSLQNIASSISSNIEDENSATARRLRDFSEKDFSSWEKQGYLSEEGLHKEDVDDDEVDQEISRVIDSQVQSFQSVGSGINQMQAHVGGGIMAVGKANGRELIGIQAGIRDLLSYQQNVQYKMDRAKVELLTRTYLVNAKFYKFMEKALHTSIFELKEITKNSKLSDYEKTSLYTESKAELRRGVLGVVRRRVGGLIGQLSDIFGKEGRENFYSSVSGMAADVEGLVGDGGGVNISKGLLGQVAGDRLAEMFVQFLPYMVSQGPVADSLKKRIDENPMLKNAVTKLQDIGNLASYNSNNGLELINYFTQYWKEFDTNQYADYEDYAAQMEEKGETPIPKPLWMLTYSAGNFAKEKVNEFMWGRDKSQGTIYTLEKREAADLTKVSYWREINNITLNDVIPGLLSRIYESVEKFRTGNEDFEAPTFSYVRGQFVSRDIARQLVKNDVFNHSNFQGIALTADSLVNVVDPEGKLSDEQRQRLAYDMIRRSDQQFGFNPYYYLNEMSDETDADQAAINQLIFERFNIDEEKINAFNEASALQRGKIAATGFTGDAAEALNTLGDLSKTLKNSIPDVTRTFLANRQAGNDQFLRELGLIYTRDGVDVFDTETIFDRIKEYLKDPYNPLLRGDLGEHRVNEPSTQNTSGTGLSLVGLPDLSAATPDKNEPGVTQTVFDSAIREFTATVNTLTDTLGNVDFSKINVSLDPIPDKLDSLQTVLDSINNRDDKQFALIEKMSACVCRQANGWGDKSENEKKQITEEEGRGKKTIMDRLRAISPRNLFNKSIETLINNQPLVLGGILGGLGTLAMHDPKAAALLTGGIAISAAYGRLRRLSEGQEPDDEENILDENGEVLLSAAKLRAGDYFDKASNAVIKSWKDIKGAVFDIAKKTYITVAQLSGRIFGPDGRALIIRGLSKARDLLNTAWNKIDIVGNARKAFEKGKETFYQQDVYVKGQSEPSLTRSGFMNGKYYCYDLNTQNPYKISGWNEIEGPVYELAVDGTLNQVISEADLAQGLLTSAGVSIDKLKTATGWLGKQGFEGLIKVKDYSLKKAGLLKDQAEKMLSSDYSGIESRLDRIYFLLCDKFGVTPQDIDLKSAGAAPNPRKPTPDDTDIIDDVVGEAKQQSSTTPNEDSRVNDKFSFESRYPNKIRLNSFEDQKERQEEKKKDQFYDDIHSIRENMEDGLGDKDEKGEKKGLFGKLASMLVGGAGLLKKMFTNPLGFMFDMGGKLLSSIFIKSPLRLMKIGSALFSGVMGLASPIYKLLSWGFGGVIWGLRKLLFKNTTESFSDFRRNRKGKGKSKKTSKSKSGRFKGSRGLVGKAAMAGLLTYELFGNNANASEKMPAGMPNYGDEEFTQPNVDEGYDDLYEGDGTDLPEVDQSVPDNQGLDYVPVPNANVLQTVGETAAYAAAPRATSRAMGAIAAKAGVKAGAHAVPGLGEALLAYDAYDGFTNTDQISETFDTNYINGRQRQANAISSVLSLGDTISPLGRSFAATVGIDSLAEEGGFTRMIEKAMAYRDMLPIPILTIPGMPGLGNWETDVSKPQRKIRLAMYGLENTDNALGKTVEILERKLGPYVRNTNNNVWIDEKAPIKSILSPLLSTGATASNVEDIYRWYRYRFEPVFKLWYSAIQVARYTDLADFDRSDLPDVLAITKQVNGALVTITPYPLDINGNIDPTTQLMQRQEANGVIHRYLTELINTFKDRGIGEDGLAKVDNKIRTFDEVKEGVSEDSGFFASIRNSVQSWGVKADEYLLPPAPKVMEIDISDLHKSGVTELDDLTMLRLSAYGNGENNPVRVDTVLRLERYCEQFFAHRSTGSEFTGNINEIYNLFKNSFGVSGGTDADMWMNWFTGRFVPVLTIWVGEIYRLRHNTPKAVWKTLSHSSRLDIAIAIKELKTVSALGDMPIWAILQSPFPGTQSNTDDEVATTVIQNLQTKAVQAKLKDPEKEDKLSNPIDLSEPQKPALTPEQEKALIDKASGQTGISVGGGDSTPASSMKMYGNAPPATMSYSDHFKRDGQGTTVTDSGVAPVNVNAPAAFPKNNTVGIVPNPGDDAGFSMDPKMGEQIVLRELIKNGITDPNEQAFVLANIAVETGNYKRTAENVNYSPKRLMEVFKRIRDKGIGYAQALVSGGKQAIADGIYKGINGNKQPGDGWLYRGRGFIQLTGRGNYERYGDDVEGDIVKNPRLVSDDPKIAAQTAISFIKKRGVLKGFKNGGFNEGVRLINGGHNGLGERKSAYVHYQQLLSSGSLKPKEDDAEDTASATEDASDTPTATSSPAPAEAEAATNPNDTVQDGATKMNAPPENTGGSDTPSLATPAVSMPDVTPPTTTSTPEVNKVDTDVKSSANSVDDASPAVATPVPRRQPEMGASSTKQEITLPEGIIKVQDDNVVTAISGLAEVLSRVLETQGPNTRRVGVGPRQ